MPADIIKKVHGRSYEAGVSSFMVVFVVGCLIVEPDL